MQSMHLRVVLLIFNFIQLKYYFKVESVKFNLKCFRNFLPHMFNEIVQKFDLNVNFFKYQMLFMFKIIYGVKTLKCSKMGSLKNQIINSL